MYPTDNCPPLFGYQKLDKISTLYLVNYPLVAFPTQN